MFESDGELDLDELRLEFTPTATFSPPCPYENLTTKPLGFNENFTTKPSGYNKNVMTTETLEKKSEQLVLKSNITTSHAPSKSNVPTEKLAFDDLSDAFNDEMPFDLSFGTSPSDCGPLTSKLQMAVRELGNCKPPKVAYRTLAIPNICNNQRRFGNNTFESCNKPTRCDFKIRPSSADHVDYGICKSPDRDPHLPKSVTRLWPDLGSFEGRSKRSWGHVTPLAFEFSPSSTNECPKAPNKVQPIKRPSGRKRRFPGPAGLLPEDSLINSERDCSAFEYTGDIDIDLNCSQDTSRFQSGPWVEMAKDFRGGCFFPPDKYNAEWIRAQAEAKLLVTQKVPIFAALIIHVECYTGKLPSATVTLRDPTGEIKAVFHHELLEQFPEEIKVGSAIVLRDFGVLSVGQGSSHYLTITLNNLVQIYSNAKSVEPTQTQIHGGQVSRHSTIGNVKTTGVREADFGTSSNATVKKDLHLPYHYDNKFGIKATNGMVIFNRNDTVNALLDVNWKRFVSGNSAVNFAPFNSEFEFRSDETRDSFVAPVSNRNCSNSEPDENNYVQVERNERKTNIRNKNLHVTHQNDGNKSATNEIGIHIETPQTSKNETVDLIPRQISGQNEDFIFATKNIVASNVSCGAMNTKYFQNETLNHRIKGLGASNFQCQNETFGCERSILPASNLQSTKQSAADKLKKFEFLVRVPDEIVFDNLANVSSNYKYSPNANVSIMCSQISLVGDDREHSQVLQDMFRGVNADSLLDDF